MADLSLDDFTAEVTAFLAANAQLKSEQRRFVWGEGPDSAALLREPDRAQEAVEIVAAKAWRAKRYDAGLGWIGGPKMYGGRQLPHAYERRYNELEARYEVTNQSYFGIGLGMVAPTINDHGQQELMRIYTEQQVLQFSNRRAMDKIKAGQLPGPETRRDGTAGVTRLIPLQGRPSMNTQVRRCKVVGP